MRRTVTVYVSAANILEGRRKSCGHCPVALAVKGLFPRSKVCVNFCSITVNKRVYLVPSFVRRFMGQYDLCVRKSVFSAFRFEMTEATK